MKSMHDPQSGHNIMCEGAEGTLQGKERCKHVFKHWQPIPRRA